MVIAAGIKSTLLDPGLPIQSAPVCEMNLFFVDFDTGGSITFGKVNMTITENIATFISEQLMTNRHYNIAISAFNIDGLTNASTTISE